MPSGTKLSFAFGSARYAADTWSRIDGAPWFSRDEGEGRETTSPDKHLLFVPAKPHVLRAKDSMGLDRLIEVLGQGQRLYQHLVSKGKLQPAAGAGWSVFSRADLKTVLPSVNLQHMRRRDWYVLRVERDQEGRARSILAYSLTWCPIFERQIPWSGSGNAHAVSVPTA